jgi:hypothetical protein
MNTRNASSSATRPGKPLGSPLARLDAADGSKPSPWTAEETDACFIVRDANGQALAYVYFEPTASQIGNDNFSTDRIAFNRQRAKNYP